MGTSRQFIMIAKGPDLCRIIANCVCTAHFKANAKQRKSLHYSLSLVHLTDASSSINFNGNSQLRRVGRFYSMNKPPLCLLKERFISVG